MASIRINQYTISSAMFMWTVCPTMISVMSFGLFTWFGGQLTVAKAFTSISLFNILEAPVSLGPMIIQYMLELRISMTRLMDFMLADELHTHNSTNFPDDAPDGSYCRAPHVCACAVVVVCVGGGMHQKGRHLRGAPRGG